MKNRLLSLILLFCAANIWAQVPYLGTPFYKQGFDVATIAATNWTQTGNTYASGGTQTPTTSLWKTTNTYAPAGKNFTNADPTSTYSLALPFTSNMGYVGTITSPDIVNVKTNVCVGFSVFNPSVVPFPTGFGYFAFQASADGGETWDELWRSDGQPTGFAYTQTSLNGVGSMTLDWYAIQVYLPSTYDNKSFKLRFYVNSPNIRSSNAELTIDGVFASKRWSKDVKLNFVKDLSGGTATNDGAYFKTPVTINFTNLGSTPVSSINLKYTLTPGSQLVTETFTPPQPLAPNATAEYTFSTLANTDGYRTNYTLQVQTVLAGDQNVSNDKLTYTIANKMAGTPYTAAWVSTGQDFDAWQQIEMGARATYPYWVVGTTLYPSALSINGASKTFDADVPLFSRPIHLKAGKKYELAFDALTNSTNAADVNAMQIYLATRFDTLSREGLPVFYKNDINNSNCRNQKVYVTPIQDTSYYFVFRYLSKARSLEFDLLSASVREVSDLDASAASLVSPVDLTPRYSVTEAIKLKVANAGLATPIEANSVKAFYQLDGGTVVQETVSAALNVGESIDYTFTAAADMSALKTYNLKTWVSLAGDNIAVNDTIISTLTPKVTTLPYNATLGTGTATYTKEDRFWETDRWTVNVLAADARWQYTGSTFNPSLLDATLYSRPINIKAGQMCEFTYQVGRSAAQTANLVVKVYTKSGNTFTLVQDNIRNISITTANNALTTYTDTFIPTADGDYYFAFYVPAISGGLKCNVLFKNPNFYQVYDDNMALTKVILPGTQVAGLDSLPLGTIVKNLGKNPVTSYSINYKINNGTTVTANFGTLAAGAQNIFYFPAKAVFAGTGNENVKVWVSHPGSDDNRLDDTLTSVVQNVPRATVPYEIIDFTTVNDWLTFDQNKDAVLWQKVTGTINGFAYNSTNAANDYLMTKQMALQSGKTYRISFEALASAYNKPFNIDLMYGKGNQVENLSLIKSYTNTKRVSEDQPFIAYVTIPQTDNYVFAFRVNGVTNIANIANSFSVSEVTGLPNAAVQLVYPTANAVFSASDSIVVNITNVGQDDIFELPIKCKLNGAMLRDSVYQVHIGVNQTYHFVLEEVDLYTPQTYNIEFYTDVTFDANRANDTARVTVTCLPKTDMKMASFIAPISGKINAALDVTVSIENLGNTTLSNFPIAYKINGTTVTETITASVAPNVTYMYTFAQKANMLVPGQYNFKTYVTCAGDVNRLNDTLTTTVYTTNETLDVEMIAIIAPETGPLTGTESVTVSLRNNTSIPLTVPLSCKVDGVELLRGAVNLPIKGTVIYTFPNTIDMSQVKTYVLSVTASYPGDEVPANNMVTKSVTFINKDLGVVRIVSPVMSLQCTSTTTVIVDIRNYGANPLDGAQVSCLADGMNLLSDMVTFSTPLRPDSVYRHTFTHTLDLSAPGDHYLKAYTSLGEDMNHGNDTAYMIIRPGYGNVDYPVLASDGLTNVGGGRASLTKDGNLFVAFSQNKGGNFNEFAQYLNQAGHQQFASEGIQISDNRLTFAIVNTSEADKEGNLIVGYTNMYRNASQQTLGELRIWKTSPTGQQLFGNEGVVISPGAIGLVVATFLRTDSRNNIYMATNTGKIHKINKATGQIIKTVNQNVSTMEFDKQDRLFVTYGGANGSLYLQVFDSDLTPTLSSPVTVTESGMDGASILLFDTENSLQSGLWVCYSSLLFRGTYYVQYLDDNLEPQIGSTGVAVSNDPQRPRLYGWPAVVRNENSDENTLAFATAATVAGGSVYYFLKGQVISKDGSLKWGDEGKDLVEPSYQTLISTKGLIYHSDTLYLMFDSYSGGSSYITENLDILLFDKEFNSLVASVRYANECYDTKSYSFRSNDYGIFMNWIQAYGLGTTYVSAAQHFNFDTRSLQNKTFSVTVRSDNSDMGYVVGGGLFNPNDNAILKATPVPGYRLKEWQKAGVAVSTSNPYIFPVTEEAEYVAVFEEGTSYIITATAGPNGTITPSGDVTVPEGNDKIFTITADPGYVIKSILVDGVNVPGSVLSGTYTFTNVQANHTIEAEFVAGVYTIVASAGIGGTISPVGTITVNSGESKTFTITPSPLYQIDRVMVDGTSVGAVSTYTFDNVITNHVIQAMFIIDGVDEARLAKLQVYPNPTTGRITIDNEKSKINTIQVYDVIGRLLIERTNVGETKATLDLSSLAKGSYILKVDGKIAKVIKQ